LSASVNTNALFAMREVGDDLLRLRQAAGLQQSQAAAELDVSRFMVGKFERGKAFPSDEQLAILLTLYAASDLEAAAVKAKIENGKSYGRAWWELPRFRKIYRGDAARFFALEDAAERVRVHAGTYVPGLLQIPEYIEAIVEFGQQSEGVEDRAAFVEGRLMRQQVLTRRNPVFLESLCLESALHAAVGGEDVRRKQLRHLRDMLRFGNVSLRVVPFSAGAPSLVGMPLTIFRFPGAEYRDVVSTEKVRGSTLDEDPAEVRSVTRLFESLAASALTQEETKQLIDTLEKDM
jgi:transcriptional regulator with XRE-family HTH domain